MFNFIIIIHALACIFLILLVLVQQGKGGGLISSLSSAESIFGTKTNTFLVKSTSVFAVVFFFTCLSLAFLSIQRNKSIITTSYKQTKQPAKTTSADKTIPTAPDKAAPTTQTTAQAAANSAIPVKIETQTAAVPAVATTTNTPASSPQAMPAAEKK